MCERERKRESEREKEREGGREGGNTSTLSRNCSSLKSKKTFKLVFHEKRLF